MRVLYFHQHFCTPQGSSGTRSYEFARALIRRGHQVTMVCGQGRPESLGLKREASSAMFRGDVDGIDVVAFPLQYSNRDGLVRRSATFLRFAWQSVLFALRTPCDLVFATSTPLTAALPGILAKIFRRKPFVFEVRDLWPELPRALGMRNPVFLGGMWVLEGAAYRASSAAVGLSPGIVEGIKRRSPRNLPIAMIPNGCDLDLMNPRRRMGLQAWGIDPDCFVAGFTGAHGVANGLDAVLDAARVLKERGNRNICFLLVGDGKVKDALVGRARREELDNCVFLDPMPKEEIAGLIASLDAGLMVLKNVPAFYYGTSPNKFFDFISAGVPVVNNYPGWLADLIDEAGCGLAVPPDDPVAFADALCTLAANPERRDRQGVAARRLAETRFSREELAEQFCLWLERFGDGAHPARVEECQAVRSQ